MPSSSEPPTVPQQHRIRRALQCASSQLLILGAALCSWCSKHIEKLNKKSSSGASGNAPSPPSSPPVPLGKVWQPPHEPARPYKKGKVEESVVGLYTEDDDDIANAANDDDNDSTAAAPSPRPDNTIQYHQHQLPEESYIMSDFSVLYAEEPSQRRLTTYGDEVSFADYSIAAFDDATTSQPPSFRHHHNNKTSDAVASSSSAQPSTKALPVVVQRIVKAPPGKLGITLEVSKEGPKIQTVKTSSPLEGLLFSGDLVIAIDDTDVRFLTLTAIHKVMAKTNDMERTITVLTLDDVTRNKELTKEESFLEFS